MSAVGKYLVIAAVALGLGALLQHQRDSGQTVLIRLEHTKKQVDSVYRVRVDTLRVWKTKYDTARVDVLAHITDTVLVKEFVARADSTIKACSDVVESCEHRVAVRDSIIARMKPKFIDRIGVTSGIGCAIGVSGRSACGLIVGGTIKLWP